MLAKTKALFDESSWLRRSKGDLKKNRGRVGDADAFNLHSLHFMNA